MKIIRTKINNYKVLIEKGLSLDTIKTDLIKSCFKEIKEIPNTCTYSIVFTYADYTDGRDYIECEVKILS